MQNEELKAELVDLADWEQSGEGWNAVTYYHKTDSSLLLKLNAVSLPYEQSLTEYVMTKAVHKLGARCPDTVSFVTDGERYGFITERFVGKRSFARILSEQPEMLDPLAKAMARMAHELHALPCDTGLFTSVPERLRNEANSCKWVKGKLKAIINECADSMRPVATCIHGDMHPGNILRTEKGDFWIDLGRFGYGDPDIDYGSQYILAHLAPSGLAKLLLHIDQSTYARFLELYGHYYYGEDFEKPETQERLRRAVIVCLSHAVAQNPAAKAVFGPYIKGRENITFFLLKLISRFDNLKRPE